MPYGIAPTFFQQINLYRHLSYRLVQPSLIKISVLLLLAMFVLHHLWQPLQSQILPLVDHAWMNAVEAGYVVDGFFHL